MLSVSGTADLPVFPYSGMPKSARPAWQLGSSRHTVYSASRGVPWLSQRPVRWFLYAVCILLCVRLYARYLRTIPDNPPTHAG